MPHMGIELEHNKQFISNTPRMWRWVGQELFWDIQEC